MNGETKSFDQLLQFGGQAGFGEKSERCRHLDKCNFASPADLRALMHVMMLREPSPSLFGDSGRYSRKRLPCAEEKRQVGAMALC